MKTLYTTSFYLPTQVVVDAQGQLIVADPGSRRIAIYKNDGSFVGYTLQGPIFHHIAIDVHNNYITLNASDNNLYVNGVGFGGASSQSLSVLALDSAGAVWVTGTKSNLSKYNITAQGSTYVATAVSPAAG